MTDATQKPWWKSKTIWANAIVLMFAAAESRIGLLEGVLPGGLYAWVAFALPIVNAGLRLITSTAVTR